MPKKLHWSSFLTTPVDSRYLTRWRYVYSTEKIRLRPRTSFHHFLKYPNSDLQIFLNI
jgi:hypothetical protein